MKVLREAGLIRVVRTRQVRAIMEKYYGRTARLFEFNEAEGDAKKGEFVDFFRQAMHEYEETARDREILTLRHARIPASKAEEFRRRVSELADEFDEKESVPGGRVYGFLAQV